MPDSFLSTVSILRAAGEPTRLRLLMLLARAELTVGELRLIVGQSQPRVSRHLKLLASAGLVDRFREEHWVYYRVPASGSVRDHVQQLLALVAPEDDVFRRDRRRLEEVIAERAQAASQQLPAHALDSASNEVDSILLRELNAEPVGALLDIGTGSGHLLELLGRTAKRAVGVDISREALQLARTNVHSAGLSHCELQQGSMYDLPFESDTFDTVTVDRALARSERPIAALNEIARAIRAEGRLVIIEDFDQLSESAGANPIAILRGWLSKAGFQCSRIQPADTSSGHLLIAFARRLAQTTAAA
ncbi:MAG TPA: metalloregulator ArsR/SmtB family transcription factor [Steroidobacteraceae bacterium]|nr:metalloregulator ArsR/SmtB family transcription factor [Steroidobacteraceae bacterium]